MSTVEQPAFLDFFDQVRIINLPTRADRRQETESEFTARGFPSPIDRGMFFPAIAPIDTGGFPNRGVRGCYLSHLEILREARAHGSNRILVLEDDIAFSREISTLGSRAVALLAEREWDIAYFGHALPSTPEDAHWAEVNQPMLLAHCYAVNGKTLDKLVDFLDSILTRPPGHPDGGPMHYDGALNTFIQQNPNIKAVYCSKNLGYQRPSRTDLHRQSIIDRNPLMLPFAGLYRAFRRAYLKITN
jgi:hypothetical protein